MADLPSFPRAPESPDDELLNAQLSSVLTEKTDAQRVRDIDAELTSGFAALADVACAVSFFGSARVAPEDPMYALGRETARQVGQAGYAIITGGGPGLMEAANRGARDAGALSIGLNIVLPAEQQPNPFQDRVLMFDHFFTRKVMFVRYATAFVVLPGGFGTFDELFEALVLIQTDTVRHFPVVLVGTAFWGGLREWLADGPLAAGIIGAHDLDLFHITDDPVEVVRIVRAGELRQGWPEGPACAEAAANAGGSTTG